MPDGLTTSEVSEGRALRQIHAHVQRRPLRKVRSKKLSSLQLLLRPTTKECLKHVPHGDHAQNSEDGIGLLLRLLLALTAARNGSLLRRHLARMRQGLGKLVLLS